MSQAFSAHASFLRYRLNVITAWPESDYKQAALAAAEAALQGEMAFERVARMGGTSADRPSHVHETRPITGSAPHSARPHPNANGNKPSPVCAYPTSSCRQEQAVAWRQTRS